MFKFMRGRGHGHLSSEKIKDLFSLSKGCRHGFPHQPSALSYDSSLSLIGIATKKGEIRVYGRPGVEYWGQLDADTIVKEMHFIPDQRGQLVILSEEGVIQLWQLPTDPSSHVLEKVASIEYFARGEGGSIRHAITILITGSNDAALIGTTGGNIYTISLSSFSVSQDADAVIYQDVVLHSVPPDFKKTSQGSVEVIAERPGHPNCYLIGYNRGLLILWNAKTKSAERVFNSAQQLESASWLSTGEGFLTCHNDGRYISWKVTDPATKSTDDDRSKIPYGPFPCKPIGRILSKTVRNGENMLFFTGGMPRSTYGDKLTVSIIQGDQDSGRHQVLDFTSKVIDFTVIDDASDAEFDNPIALIVLLEEEIVLIDVRDANWLPFKLPYLSSVHSSGITACQHYSDLTDDVFQQLLQTGAKQDQGKFSSSVWPITGGALPQQQTAAVHQSEETTAGASLTLEHDQQEEPQDVIPGVTDAAAEASAAGRSSDDREEVKFVDKEEEQGDGKVTTTIAAAAGGGMRNGKTNDILITGHEDGSILFWDASDCNLHHVLTISSRKYFVATDSDIAPIDGDDVSPDADADGSEWPPFRKVGTFDPYSDDTRLAIRRLALCPMTGVFAAAGTAGQVIYFKLNQESGEKVIPIHSSNLVEETTGFVWKGHEQLHVRTNGIKTEPGYEAEFVIQLSPPAATTALAVNSEWNLLSAGTAHGFVVFDLIQNSVVLSKCTLNPADLIATAGGDVLISRRKSFKKSLRESFRRLRRGRGASTRVKKAATSAESSPEKTAAETPVHSPIRSIVSADDADTGKPVERQIEARQDDGLGSMIRTISYATANITTAASAVPTIWIGTNAGTVLIYTISLPEEEEKRQEEESVSMTLAKEIQLKHRAPVIFIQVIDSTGYPLPGPHEVANGKAKAPSTIGNQRVLIVSEEQFKLFTLPNLKPDRKSKLTAHEGSRARRIAVSQFFASQPAVTGSGSPQQPNAKSSEHCLTCCSNQGDVSVYSISDLRRIQNHDVIRREDVHGISSVVLTTRGEGLFLHSPSEFQRFSLAAHRIVAPAGFVTIPDGVRPVLVPAVPEESEVLPAASADEEKAQETARAVVESAIREETEEEIAAATLLHAVDPPAAAPVSDAVPAASDEPIGRSSPLPPLPEGQPITQPGSANPTQDHAISSTLVEDVLAPAVASFTLLESALNGNDEDDALDQDPAIVRSVIERAFADDEDDVTTTTTLIPDVVNGVNGHKKNGHVGVDEDDDSSDGQLNGGANGIDSSANASVLTADITIDSVRDFTNLTSSGKKTPAAASAASQSSSTTTEQAGATTPSTPTSSSSNQKTGKNSNIPRSNSNRGAAGAGGSGARRKKTRTPKETALRKLSDI